MPNATIYDVARKAGVSIATVSNALNTPARVKAGTLQRIYAVIDELQFVPKAEASARARKAVGRVGVVAPFTTYPTFAERVKGVLEALRELPYETVLYDQRSISERSDYLTSLPVARHLDGLVVMALPFDDEVASRLRDRELETVLVEFRLPGFSGVELDNAAGGRLAAEHLLSRGRRRPAFVGERQVSNDIVIEGARRLTGFRRALAALGVGLPDEYVSLAPYGVDEARRQAHALLELPEPPDAVFAHSDAQAIGVLKAARDRGLSVPLDLAVVGFDDTDAAEHLGLTTVRQPLVDSGRVAVRLLLERLEHPTRPVQQVTLPVTLVQRETT